MYRDVLAQGLTEEPTLRSVEWSIGRGSSNLGASLPLVRDYPANKASASMTSGSVTPAMMS